MFLPKNAKQASKEFWKMNHILIWSVCSVVGEDKAETSSTQRSVDPRDFIAHQHCNIVSRLWCIHIIRNRVSMQHTVVAVWFLIRSIWAINVSVTPSACVNTHTHGTLELCAEIASWKCSEGSQNDKVLNKIRYEIDSWPAQNTIFPILVLINELCDPVLRRGHESQTFLCSVEHLNASCLMINIGKVCFKK